MFNIFTNLSDAFEPLFLRQFRVGKLLKGFDDLFDKDIKIEVDTNAYCPG